ncbi:IMG1 [Cyberlindnera jadinii]|uniref:IMG1 protein n=2 Tax=Cyberlindnera jadinii (strain ATCC 18201 / CBS 1600 / BCRC 20928 / JCM 3617 / NBRC 0987 / NRRL Y-1542) TaxID=983966 RepID=A0A0H5CDY7_CYBJN|nr:IMG1 [Cyberlindnera jadinii]
MLQCLKRAVCSLPQGVRGYHVPSKSTRVIKVYEPLLKEKKKTNAMEKFYETQRARLDPTGWRSSLLKSVRPGDVVRVMYTSRAIPPFVGQVIAMSKKQLDTNITLRNQVSKVGVEVKVKLYSPLVSRIDVIRKPHAYKKRNRQYYIRGNRLDVGDLEASLRKR